MKLKYKFQEYKEKTHFTIFFKKHFLKSTSNMSVKKINIKKVLLKNKFLHPLYVSALPFLTVSYVYLSRALQVTVNANVFCLSPMLCINPVLMRLMA